MGRLGLLSCALVAGVLADPLACSPAPLSYGTQGRTLSVWSTGHNGLNEGGPAPGRDDHGLTTQAPK